MAPPIVRHLAHTSNNPCRTLCGRGAEEEEEEEALFKAQGAECDGKGEG